MPPKQMNSSLAQDILEVDFRGHYHNADVGYYITDKFLCNHLRTFTNQQCEDGTHLWTIEELIGDQVVISQELYSCCYPVILRVPYRLEDWENHPDKVYMFRWGKWLSYRDWKCGNI